MSKKKFILIIIVILVLIALIGVNIYLYNRKGEEYKYTILKNENIKGQHCTEEICFSDMEIVDAVTAEKVVVRGYFENMTSEKLDGKVEFIFNTDYGVSNYSYDISLKPNEKIDYESYPNDKRLLKVNDYSITFTKEAN